MGRNTLHIFPFTAGGIQRKAIEGMLLKVSNILAHSLVHYSST